MLRAGLGRTLRSRFRKVRLIHLHLAAMPRTRSTAHGHHHRADPYRPTPSVFTRPTAHVTFAPTCPCALPGRNPTGHSLGTCDRKLLPGKLLEPTTTCRWPQVTSSFMPLSDHPMRMHNGAIFGKEGEASIPPGIRRLQLRLRRKNSCLLAFMNLL
jgi:hypothetical protein